MKRTSISDTSGQDVVLTASKSTNKWWVAAGLLILFGGYLFWNSGFKNWVDTDTTVALKSLRVAKVTRGDLISDISLQGKVIAAVSPRLYAPADGIIDFKVNAGDSVRLNQVLATIDSPQLTNQLQQEEASLMALSISFNRQKLQSKRQDLHGQKRIDLAKIALSAAQREKRRADKAFTTHAINQIDYEKAQDDMRNAKLVYEHAIKDLQLNRESQAFEVRTRELQVERQKLKVDEIARKVAELELRSPVSGIVGNLAVVTREKVARDQAIVSVVDLSHYELEVQIPESYADNLSIGMAAEVTVNNQLYHASLVTISPEVSNNQVTGRVRFDHTGNGELTPSGLRQNQRLTTRILLQQRPDVLMVQKGAFLQGSNGKFAYRIREDVAYRTSIQLGNSSLSQIEVLSGLDEHDTIIISGIDRFNGAGKLLITQ